MDSTTFAPAASTARPPLVAAGVAIVGGVLGLAALVLNWEEINVGRLSDLVAGVATTAKGYEENAGKVCAVIAVVAIVLAAAWIARAKVPNIAGLLIAGGVVMVAFTALAFVGIQKDISDFNDGMKSLGVEGTSANVGIGLYLEIVAGVLVAAAGVLPRFVKR